MKIGRDVEIPSIVVCVEQVLILFSLVHNAHINIWQQNKIRMLTHEGGTKNV